MTVYYTADQHFGHENIIQYSGRPFHYVNEMKSALVANWNAVVQPGDTAHVPCCPDRSRRRLARRLRASIAPARRFPAGMQVRLREHRTEMSTDPGWR
jgi:hypothetical protein